MVHAAYGLYRLSEYPSSRHEDVVAAWLRAGGAPAVVSHESALELLGLSDVIPDAVHLTVPRNMRYRRYLAGVVVHTTTRNPERSELVTVEGLPTTSASRSIVDAAETGLGPEQVTAAVHDAIDRAMVSPAALEEAAKARGARVARLVRRSFGTSPG
jgi:predicted transcriptional regulator of viral defense system